MPNHHERFTALYNAYQQRVYAYAASRAGRQLAEEVVSETFLVAWRRLDDIPDEARLQWLFRVARNILQDNYRQAARRESLDAELKLWVEEATGDVGEQVAERAAMLRALATLSEDDREILTLTAWHGLSAAEAAKVVGCAKATFFVRLHRARRRLEAALGDTRATKSPKSVLVPGGELR